MNLSYSIQKKIFEPLSPQKSNFFNSEIGLWLV